MDIAATCEAKDEDEDEGVTEVTATCEAEQMKYLL